MFRLFLPISLLLFVTFAQPGQQGPSAPQRLGHPSWSPDGQRIVYDVETAGRPVLFEVRANGAANHILSRFASGWHDSQAVWSPDGSRLAFVSNREGGQSKVFVGHDLSNATALAAEPGVHTEPAWSPDGRLIAYVTADAPGAPRDIVINEPSGKSRLRVTMADSDESSPSFSPDGRLLAFASTRNGVPEIYTMTVKGESVRALTTQSHSDMPRWSSTDAIAFRSRRDGNAEIYVMQADGTGQRRVTTDPEEDENPAWSPDGARLAFTSRRGGAWKILTMSASGGDIYCVQRDCGRTTERLPAFSPDGRHIAYLRAAGRDSSLVIAQLDGTVVRQVPGGSKPVWLADGRSIGLLVRQTPNQPASLRILDVATGETRVLTETSAGDDMPVWSPDGKRIALTSGDRNGSNLFVMNADGSERQPLTTDGPGVRNGWPSWARDRIAYSTTRGAAPGSFSGSLAIVSAGGGPSSLVPTRVQQAECPAFAPDARRIAFQAQPEPHNIDIFIVGVDGSGERRLTNDPALDEAPAWSPDGRTIAFQSDRSGSMKVYFMNADGTGVRRLTRDQ